MSNTKHKFIYSQKSPKIPKKHKNTQVLGPILDVSGLILDVFTAGNKVFDPLIPNPVSDFMVLPLKMVNKGRHLIVFQCFLKIGIFRTVNLNCYDYFADFKEILVKSETRFGISVSIYPKKPSPYVVLSLFSVSAKSRVPGFHHLYVPTDLCRTFFLSFLFTFQH